MKQPQIHTNSIRRYKFQCINKLGQAVEYMAKSGDSLYWCLSIQSVISVVVGACGVVMRCSVQHDETDTRRRRNIGK